MDNLNSDETTGTFIEMSCEPSLYELFTAIIVAIGNRLKIFVIQKFRLKR